MKLEKIHLTVAGLLLAAMCGCNSQSKISLDKSDISAKIEAAENKPQSSVSVQKSDYYTTISDSPTKSLWDDVWKLPNVILTDAGEIIEVDENVFWLLMAGGGSIALHSSGADDRIAKSAIGQPGINGEVDKLLDLFGGPGFHFAFSGAWYLWAANGEDYKGQQEAWTMLKALSVTGSLTLGLKAIRDDRTPNDKKWAWPSGHTSSSFTVASVLDELYGPQIGIPAYLGAGVVGWRMMDSGDHWASDVLFGGVLGYIVGHHVAGKHDSRQIAGFEVMPLTHFNGEPGFGVGFFKEF